MIKGFSYNKPFYFLPAALLLCCLFFTACENSKEELQAMSAKRIPIEQAKSIDSYLSQGGKMRAHLTAPEMNRFQSDSPYVEFPSTLHVDFYNDSLEVESQLFSKYGRYRETEQKVFLKDSVTVHNVNKDTLRSDELWWDQNTQKFYTDKKVQIHQPDKIIFGKGLEADQSFNWWIIKQVTGEVLVPKEGFGAFGPKDSTATGDSTAPGGSIAPKDSAVHRISPAVRLSPAAKDTIKKQ